MPIADLSNVLKYFSQATPDEEAQQALYEEILLMTLARAASSDANVDLDEIETVKAIVLRETGVEVTSEDVRRAARSELYEKVSLRKYLRNVGRQLSSEHRAKIARALADVIRSDTTINVLEIDFFNRVADALRVTPAELVGLTAR